MAHVCVCAMCPVGPVELDPSPAAALANVLYGQGLHERQEPFSARLVRSLEQLDGMLAEDHEDLAKKLPHLMVGALASFLDGRHVKERQVLVQAKVVGLRVPQAKFPLEKLADQSKGLGP